MNTFWGRRHTVTVVRQAQDRYGDPNGEPTRIPIPGFVWSPLAAGQQPPERYDRGETATETLMLYGPRDADLRHDDQVELPDGRTFQVVGEPRRWDNPFVPTANGCEATLQRVLG